MNSWKETLSIKSKIFSGIFIQQVAVVIVIWCMYAQPVFLDKNL